MNQSPSRPTWAEIDLAALAHNLRVIRDHVGDEVKILAAVKANAYGHGAIECARRLESEGVDWFGVALPEEGVELRNAGIMRPILCLGGFWSGQEAALLHQKLTPVVYRLDMIESLDCVARNASVVADVHLKIDTGMGRLGVRADEVSAFCDALTRLQNIRVDGLMTHLAAADDESKEEFTDRQLNEFDQAVAIFRQRGFSPTFIHAANSAATFAKRRAADNLVRPGGSLYGFTRDVFPGNIDAPQLRPVMSLHSTLPIGYDDGYRRALSNRARVIIRGQFSPVVGRVSMDLTLIDVTDVAGVSLDDEVILLGCDKDLSITAEEFGELAGTISYEITCGISGRVPRIYKHENTR
ncbi:MAG: alanine racemase [Acidobacteria bacterium]|nr:MAG: alanine racemase [Acidobacteriota bacterium]